MADVTEHPTIEGKVYLAVVLDAWSRRIVGWSIADHLRTELVVDALEMACLRRRPKPGELIHHADHGTQYTSWAFGQRLRKAGLLGSMGTVGDALDNAMAESFFATLQLELLDRKKWSTRRELAQAIFEYIEAFYNPRDGSVCRYRSASSAFVVACVSSPPAPDATSSGASPASKRRANNATNGTTVLRSRRQGDLAGLEALLARDVELTGDGGGKVPTLARSLRGRSRVAHTLINGIR